MPLGVQSGKMDTKRHSKNIPAKKSCRKFREIRAWILWSLKTIQGSQIPGLVNLTKGLETLHWCLAARWRIGTFNQAKYALIAQLFKQLTCWYHEAVRVRCCTHHTCCAICASYTSHIAHAQCSFVPLQIVRTFKYYTARTMHIVHVVHILHTVQCFKILDILSGSRGACPDRKSVRHIGAQLLGLEKSTRKGRRRRHEEAEQTVVRATIWQ